MLALVAWPTALAAPQNDDVVRDEVRPAVYLQAVYEPSPDSTRFSCVLYVQARMGIREVWGYPKLVHVSQSPRIGGAVITREGPLGHAAYIEDISNGKLYVSESNFIPGKVSRRVINMDSPVIRGYYP